MSLGSAAYGRTFVWVGIMRFVSLMKLAVAAVPIALAAPVVAQTNLDFNNDLEGWTTNVTYDQDGYPRASFGTSDWLHGIEARGPGNYFGYVGTGLGADVPTTLAQSIHLLVGQTLTGYVAFAGGEDLSTYGEFNDWSKLTINGASLFSSSIVQLGSATGTTGWVQFSYTAATEGDYLLQLAVANGGDNEWDSTAALDDISVLPPHQGAVPESATWMMMVVGFGLAGAAFRTRRRTFSLG